MKAITFIDVPYKTTPQGEVLADIYLPEPGGQKVPVIFYIHGGGWVQGSKNINEKSEALYQNLIDSGIAVISLAYRLCKNGITFPTPADDCMDGIRFFLRNAEKYNFDTSKVALFGASAGAHLALMAAYAIEKFGNDSDRETFRPSFRCVLDYCGPVDMTISRRVSNQKDSEYFVTSLYGVVPNREELLKKAAWSSPLHHAKMLPAEKLPPVFAVQGQMDELVYFRQPEFLEALYKEKGASFELLRVVNGNHAFGQIEGMPAPAPDYPEIFRQSAEFVKKHLL